MNEIMVSITCPTYNQEKYIAQTIESFLNQKTNFKFEILIGEDCSPDHTREIVQEYVDKFPGVVKMVTSETNVGARNNGRRLFDAAVGRYIAICEGDDYWIDELKLQKQVDFLESHPDYSFTYHSAKYLNMTTNRFDYISRSYNESCDAQTNDIITGGGGFCPSASIVYRRASWNDLPQFYYDALIGDYPKQMILAHRGKVHYFDEIMSVYRWYLPGSWTTANTASYEKNKNVSLSMIQLLKDFDDYTDGKYKEAVRHTIQSHLFEVAHYSYDLKGMKSPENRIFYKKLHPRTKFKIYLHHYLPWVHSKIEAILVKRRSTKK